MHCMVKLLNFVFSTKSLQCVKNFFSVAVIAFSLNFLNQIVKYSNESCRVSGASSVCRYFSVLRRVHLQPYYT